MTVLGALIPVSLFLGGLGLAAFIWCLKSRQFDDLEGDQHRALFRDTVEHSKNQE
ncbi:MAG: cbb3-type cytochrome oxidase assembly protein CcoS [Pseudomonadota bacterium]